MGNRPKHCTITPTRSKAMFYSPRSGRFCAPAPGSLSALVSSMSCCHRSRGHLEAAHRAAASAAELRRRSEFDTAWRRMNEYNKARRKAQARHRQPSSNTMPGGSRCFQPRATRCINMDAPSGFLPPKLTKPQSSRQHCSCRKSGRLSRVGKCGVPPQ